jgi:hypothetical protein
LPAALIDTLRAPRPRHREPLSALTGRPGSKRVSNYMKRADEGAVARRLLSREELELLDVARGMEEQLLEQYKQVGIGGWGWGWG